MLRIKHDDLDTQKRMEERQRSPFPFFYIIMADLKHYVIIPPAAWPLLRYGRHIRYMTKDGTLRPGGFIIKSSFYGAPQEGTHHLKEYMLLQNGFKSKQSSYRQWPVEYNTIQTLYAKLNAVEWTILQSQRQSIISSNENFEKMATKIHKL